MTELGRGKSTISEYKGAAEVSVKCSVDRTLLLDKANQLSAIHSLPEPAWPEAVGFIVKAGLSAAETKQHVELARNARTPKQAAALFLKKTTDRELQRIRDLVEKVAGDTGDLRH